MGYTEAQEKIRTLEKKYSELMKRSFQTAAKCRNAADGINSRALEIKKELDLLKTEHSSF